MANLMTTKLVGKIEHTGGEGFVLKAFRGDKFSFAYVYTSLSKAQNAAATYKVSLG
jgi:hypothetical protein